MEVDTLAKLVELPLGVVLRQSEEVMKSDGATRLLTIRRTSRWINCDTHPKRGCL